MNYEFIAKTSIFRGIAPTELKVMLSCLQGYTKKYTKGEYVYRAGSHVQAMGLVLFGSVNIEQNDIWGNQNIFANIKTGQVFAETYACTPSELMMVDVIAVEQTEILFLNIEKVLKLCPSNCDFHNHLIRNLLSVMASKNLNLTYKITHITSKSIRGRLLSYLSYQAMEQGTYNFEIPFNRQQLADYLCVDRSAMSNELSKMQKDGLLTYHKNKFYLHEHSYEMEL